MIKRFAALMLTLVLLTGVCLPAQASVATLDQALSRRMDAQTDVRFSATLQLKTLMPFDEANVALLNGVLKHVSAEASIHQDGDEGSVRFALAVDGQAMMDATETRQGDQYTFETSLLPNRTLSSAVGSPMDRLLAADAGTAAASTDGQTDATSATAEPAGTESDIAQAFDMLSAVAELQTCYQALTDGIQPFAEEKRANYNIKGIGAGKWSRVARLTAEQSGGLLNELRAVLSCGMDDTYREQIAQATFGAGFVVALYRNADSQDICVYMKGNLVYPDGDKRRLVWQWAFNTNGLKRKDTYKYEVSRLSGTTDSRLIAASCTQESRTDLFSIDGKTETTLKRAKTADKNITKINLSGQATDVNAMTCKGSVSQELIRTENGDSDATLESSAVDLVFTPDDAGSTMSGTIAYAKNRNKEPQTEIDITLADTVSPMETATVAADAETAVLQPGTGTDTATAAPDSAKSSIEEIADDQPQATQTPEATDGGAYLVGTAPIGLTAYAAPQTPATVDLDSSSNDQQLALLSEASQNLAGRLLAALAALPQEDVGLLRDGMSDQDFEAFLALLNAR